MIQRYLTADAATAYDVNVNRWVVAIVRTRRWFIAFAIVMLGIAGAGLFPPVAVGETPVALTPVIQARLMGATPIQGRRIDRQMFNGKPIIVTVFASW